MPGLSLGGSAPLLYPEHRAEPGPAAPQSPSATDKAVEQPQATLPAAPASPPAPEAKKPDAHFLATAKSALKSAVKRAPKVNVASIDDIVRMMERHTETSEVGVRTLIASDALQTRLADEVWNIATALLAAGRSLVIVDWNLESNGIAAALEHQTAPGLVELLKGSASFEDVIGPVLDTDVHMIPAGHGRGDSGDDIDIARVADVLDALDGVYDHIIIAANVAAAAQVFEALEGRFDTGVVIAEAGAPPAPEIASPTHFLGFEIESFDVAVYTPFGAANADFEAPLHKAG